MMPRSRQHAMPTDLDALLRVRDRIKRGEIEAPFRICEAAGCENGWIRHDDYEHATSWLTECQNCDGTGRIYMLTRPSFVLRLRAWWAKFSVRKFLAGIAWALGVATLIVVLTIELILWMTL